MNTNTMPSLKKNPDSLFERIFVSSVAFAITATLCIVWFLNGAQFLETLISDEEYRAELKERLDAVWTIFLICSIAFVCKGYSLTTDRRKGSARLQLNKHCNGFISVNTGVMLVIASGVLQNDGLIGLVARAIVSLLLLGWLAMFRRIHQYYEFIDMVMFHDFIGVGDILGYGHNRGDIPNIDNGRYEVIDIHLRGVGGVIAKDVNTGDMVDIPSTTAFRAMVGRRRTN